MTRPHRSGTDRAMIGNLDVSFQLKGARLLILGGTGFLGKVFWTLILDRYPDVEQIFLLVRSMGGRTSEERFWHSIVTSECMGGLRKTYPGEAYEALLREKVTVIDGDVGQPLCGLDSQLLLELKGSVDAVVNVAGIVDFNPPLDEAIKANAVGARNLVALCRALGDVPLFHTSTCYVAGSRKGPIFEEHPCTHPFPRCDELDVALWEPEREVEECLSLIEGATRSNDREKLIEAGVRRANYWGWPNTYTYTKSLGEQIIARSGLPFVIARPACCETTQSYPFPGWNEGISTSAPIIYLAMKGQLHVPTLHVPLDFIPTDYVAAGMILSLVELLEGRAKPVYQYGASDVNPATAARLGELIGLYKRKHYAEKKGYSTFADKVQAFYEPLFVTEARFDKFGPPAVAAASRKVARALRRVSSTGVARPYADSTARSLEKVAKREDRISSLMKLFIPFTTRENGPFDCSNTRAAFARLSDDDRKRLPWAPEAIDYAVWMHEIHLPAMERWVIPEMEKKLRRKPSSRSAKAEHRAAHRESRLRTETPEPRRAPQLPPAVQNAGKRVLGHLREKFYQRAMRPTVTGQSFIPHDRNVIVVSNHASHLDMGLVRHALGDYGDGLVALAATDYFFRGTFRRAFFQNFSNLHPVDRKGGLRRTLRQAGEVIGQSKTVLIFPEGTRSRTGEIQEFKPLIGHLALTHNVDILPVYLGGTHASMPKGSLFPIHRTVVARIGPPLRVEDLRRLTEGLGFADAVREIARLARGAIEALKKNEVLDLSRETPRERISDSTDDESPAEYEGAASTLPITRTAGSRGEEYFS